MKQRDKLFCLIVLTIVMLLGTIGTELANGSRGDTPKGVTTSIKIEGDDASRIRDSYNNMVMAQQNFQYNILQARYNLQVPKEYIFNIQTFSFDSPPPTPLTPPKEKKEVPKP